MRLATNCERSRPRKLYRVTMARPAFGKDVRSRHLTAWILEHRAFSLKTAKPFLNRISIVTTRKIGTRSMSVHFPSGSPKIRATLYLPQDLLDEARDAAVHLGGFPLRLTLTKFAERAFRAELQRLKDTYNAGCNFPPREEDLKGGRPIAA
jgi:hypothetical protein